MLQNVLNPAASLQRPRSERNLMIESLEIENFRCFEKLSVSDLGLVNVVVGESAAGKTALLEAIALGMGGSPDLPIRFRIWRGMGAPTTISPSRANFEALWHDLFYQMDLKRTIRINLRGTAESTRSLAIQFRSHAIGTVAAPPLDSPASVPGPLDSSLIAPIAFMWTDVRGEEHVFEASLNPQGAMTVSGLGWPAQAAFFSSAFMAIVGPSEAANQFSEFSKKKMDGPVRQALKQVFPNIKDVSSENLSGNQVLYCSVPWMKEKAPVALVSGGVNKLLVLLLGIATMTKGVISIDELENGIYYKTYPDVWKSLLHFAEEFNTQLFVSTHSMECLREVRPTLRRNEGKFRLLRAEKKGKKRLVRVFGGEEFEAAMEYRTEVR